MEPSCEKQLLENTTPSGRVRILTLNRPNARNALNRKLSALLFRALRNADEDDNIRAIVLTGTSPMFCAGADIHELRALNAASAYEQQWLRNWHTSIREMRTPLIAAVNGLALGGGFELVLMADIVYADKDAGFGLPEVGLGTIPGAGGSIRLMNAVGKSKALEMIWTGDRMDGLEACRRGIVSKVCDEVVNESVELAERIGTRSVTAVSMVKEVMKVTETKIESELRLEQMMYYISFGSREFEEGCRAFAERRRIKKEP